MFEIGEYLVYRKDVCKVINIKEKDEKKFYQLVSIDDESLKIEVPIENKDGALRKLISKEEIEVLINRISSIELIDCDDKMIELEYRNLLASGNREDIIKVIKTTYLRNKARIANKKRVNEKDNNYLEKAEKLLYKEFSIVLDLTVEATREYVLNRVEAV